MTHPIVRTARGWIGTRFHHQGRIKKTGSHKGGVDCLGLLSGVAAELNLRGPDGQPLITADETNYPHRPDASRLRARLEELLILLPPLPFGGRAGEGEARESLPLCHPLPNPPPETGEGIIMPGDILLLNIDDSPQHLAIVSDFPSLRTLPLAGEGINLGIIHAYVPARAVVEHLLDNWWIERIEAAFRVDFTA